MRRIRYLNGCLRIGCCPRWCGIGFESWGTDIRRCCRTRAICSTRSWTGTFSLTGQRFARDLKGRTLQFFGAEWDFSDDKEKKLRLLARLARLEGRVPGRDYRIGDLNLVFSQAAESQEFMRLDSRGLLSHRTEGTKHVFDFRSSMMAWWVLQWI